MRENELTTKFAFKQVLLPNNKRLWVFLFSMLWLNTFFSLYKKVYFQKSSLVSCFPFFFLMMKNLLVLSLLKVIRKSKKKTFFFSKSIPHRKDFFKSQIVQTVLSTLVSTYVRDPLKRKRNLLYVKKKELWTHN